MSIREKLAGNPLVGVVAVLVVAGVVALIFMQRGHKPVVDQTYYYDLDDNKMFADAVGKVPPFQTASGHTAVVAAVFACGTCGGPDTRFVSYLEKYSDALRQAQAAGGVIEPDVAKAGHLIRAVDGADWVPSSTAKATPILEEAQKRCGTQTPVACQP